MQRELERKRIRSAFGAAAESYDAVAVVQRTIATELAARLATRLAKPRQPDCAHPDSATRSTHILDAGCGTGHARHLLLQGNPDARITALDAAFAMCAKAAGDAVCADLEHLPFRSALFDVYWSSLAWQWTEPLASIGEAARVLKPGATLAVATLGPQTLNELRDAFAHVDDEQHVRSFVAPSAYPGLLYAAGFKDVEIARHTIKVFAPNLRELLRGIRELGANTVGAKMRRGLMGRSAWNKLAASYEHWRDPEGLPASYDAVFIIAVKA